jgi:putative hydrolase of the HAD superfamily
MLLLDCLLHRLGTDPSSLAAALKQAIEKEHSRLRAGGIGHPEVRIEAVWDGLFPGRQGEELSTIIIEHELAVHPAWPMPGCHSLLAALKQRGLVLGIVSNAQFYTPLFLEALLGGSPETLGFSPSLCLYSCDFGFAKPDQLLFDAACQRLHTLEIASEDVLFVGNSMADDIIPAGRNGFMTVLAALDAHAFELPRALQEKGRDAVVSHLSRISMLIEESDRSPG